jgi:tRNA-splicing ligase RtcB
MGEEWKDHLEQVDDALFRISQHGEMNADAMLVADAAHLAANSDDRSPGQLVNTAMLPGVVGEAWAMADFHYGYGFPIGGVVATDVDGEGVTRRSWFRHQLRSPSMCH